MFKWQSFLVCFSRVILFLHISWRIKIKQNGSLQHESTFFGKYTVLADKGLENQGTSDRGVGFIRASQLMHLTQPFSVGLKLPLYHSDQFLGPYLFSSVVKQLFTRLNTLVLSALCVVMGTKKPTSCERGWA